MKHIVGLLAIFVTLGACGGMAEAQQPKKVPRIGYPARTISSSFSSPEQLARILSATALSLLKTCNEAS